MADRYGAEGLRYFLLRESVPHSDGNFSQAALVNVLNNELANTLGNLVRFESWVSLTILPVRVGFLYPGQEHGGRTGWTGQAGQILHCRGAWMANSKRKIHVFKSGWLSDKREYVTFKLAIEAWYIDSVSILTQYSSIALSIILLWLPRWVGRVNYINPGQKFNLSNPSDPSSIVKLKCEIWLGE